MYFPSVKKARSSASQLILRVSLQNKLLKIPPLLINDEGNIDSVT